MKILILGMDGYLGWSLAQFMTARGYEVAGADMFFRRNWVMEMQSHSAIPIADMRDRLNSFKKKWGETPYFEAGDLTEWNFVSKLFKHFQPHCVVHLGECPSAPYSMIDVHHATSVQRNNLMSTLNVIYAINEYTPDAHLIKLGTMGEYGTPDLDIPEGFFEVEFRGRKETMPFPRNAGSWYHWSKVHGSNNIMFACRLLGIRATDIMQGVVFGTQIDEMAGDEKLFTRLDFDEAFGTIINRLCCQAVIGHKLTLYGEGHQKRSFLPLRDSMQCLTLVAENPPEKGEYRVFNQFDEVYDIMEMAQRVAKVGSDFGLNTEIYNIENPRLEKEQHYYNPDRQNLINIGYQPTHDLESELRIMIPDLIRYKDRIEEVKDVLVPSIRWSGKRRRSNILERTCEY